MNGYLILHIINIVGMCIVDTGIDGLCIRKKVGGTIRGINPLNFVPMRKRDTEMSEKL